MIQHFNSVEASAFMLRVLGASITSLPINSFEEKIETINDDGETNKSYADIYQLNGKIIECKSWKPNASTFQGFVSGSATSNSYSQFLNYLRSINSLDGLEYWFDGEKGI
ncbi:hypothetical protein [Cellulophaga sp. BC115SP]|uniref:hypothetical protein n=1 Tax=Cellulophaga sp. BC115SP TaxID=2683263 RepID=UPI001412C03F|nr:hypothetical protein [Cellulophaga sp. BC115SP]NBB31840.1 hypothetical protein [Cellulophaga sp. BC115SP]